MPKKITGKVVSTKMKNAVVVEAEKFRLHPKYHKQIKRRKRFIAHTTGEIKVGTRVTIIETKPLSRKINWKIVSNNQNEEHGTT